MNIVILDGDTVSRNDIDLRVFEKFGNLTYYGFTPNELVIERIGNADAVFCNKAVITAEVFERCPDIKYIGIFATGYNNIDLEAAKRHNVCVCNVPGYSTDAVAQHVFALILSFYNRVSEYNNEVHHGSWIKSNCFSVFNIPIYELSGQTIGIIGFGNIGRKVSEIAKSFNMRILVNTRTIRDNAEGVEYVSLEKLLSESDIVTLHCPLTSETEGLICRKTLDFMKKTAILINTTRGPVVNEDDLAKALKEGKIAGAGLDVVAVEPMLENNPLLDAPNCILTPHIAWAPQQTRERLVSIVVDNFTGWLDGKAINTVV